MIKLRPPIVTVLGHVDHGKTTLLDAIGRTSVAKKEAGGITQSIGASVVTTKADLPAQAGKKITFIDTPGHVAFSSMRSRGAKVADIAILVVAANDGVKPQTREALKHILEAKIAYIVAITKIDLASAKIESARSGLEKIGVSFEGSGGQVPLVLVSGKTSQGVEELLEMINLVAEVNEVKGDSEGALEAVVIEVSKDKKGPLASVVVRNGTLKVASEIAAGGETGKVRGIFDDRGKAVKQVLPGYPGQVLGFSQLPPVGAKVTALGDKEVVEKKEKEKREEIRKGQIPAVFKAKSAGSLEALLESIPEEVYVVSAGMGEVTETDIFLAKPAEARVFAFGTKVALKVANLAKTEGVVIESFEVIYKLFERLAELIESGKEEILGEAQVLASFPYNDKKIAGCKVLSGRITRQDSLVLMRGEKELGKVKIVSMKRQKQTVSLAKEGEEFGALLKPQLDFKPGDMLVSVHK